MTRDTTNRIHELIRVNIESSKGFQRAADAVRCPSFTCLFRQIAHDRLDHADRLRVLLGSTDARPPRAGTIRGWLRRWWRAVRESLNGVEDDIVLIEAERDESVIERRYEESLASVHDPTVRRLLDEQHADVRRVHAAVRGLRDMVAFESREATYAPVAVDRRPTRRLRRRRSHRYPMRRLR